MIMRKIAGAGLLIVIAVVTTCTPLMDRYNASGAEKDIPGLLKRQGIVVTGTDCAMLPGSREFTCEMKITAEMASKLRTKFKLRAAKADDLKFKYYRPAGCETLAQYRDAKTEKHYIPNARQSERIPELSSFTHMRFHFRPDLGRACLRSAYGYG